jgi:hypothetical protein
MAYSGRVLAVSAALLLSTLAGCSNNSASRAPTSDPSSTSTPSPSQTTSEPPSESEVAEQSASKVVRDYYETVGRLRQDPSQPLSQLKAVANGGQLAAQETFTRNQRKAGNRQTGDAKVLEVLVQSVNLQPAKGQVPEVQLDVCWDVSDVDVLDPSGKSVVSPDRADVGWTRYTVTNHEWAKRPEDGWRVISGQDLEKAPCSAA